MPQPENPDEMPISGADSGAFDRIAPGWYNFRHWSIFRRELEDLAARWSEGRLLNVGCGHGPDFLPFRQGFRLCGLDFSGEMLRQARRYAQKFEFNVELVRADMAALPFAAAAFDYVIAVASYHHLRGHARQLTALRELYRVLKPGGEAFVTVWNRGQVRFRGGPSERLITWRTGEEVVLRYYKLFSYDEFEELVAAAGFHILRSSPESGYHGPVKNFSRNICLLVRKPD